MDVSSVYRASDAEWSVKALKTVPACSGSTDLNELVGGVIREVCPPGMIVRRDPLPVVTASSLQLHHAFRMLVQAVVAFPPASGRHFLYFKYREPRAGANESGTQPGTITILTNINAAARSAPAIKDNFDNVRALFRVNGIHIAPPQEGGADCVYLLTIAGKPVT